MPTCQSCIATARPIRARSRKTPISSCGPASGNFRIRTCVTAAAWENAPSAPAACSRAAEHLPEPNWKEKQRLGPQLEAGYRLLCQLWLTHDIELEQDKDPLRALKS